MTSFRQTLQKYDIVSSGKRTTIYDSCKELSKYIAGGLSIMKVADLTITAIAIRNYIRDTNITTPNFTFGNHEIRLDVKQYHHC